MHLFLTSSPCDNDVPAGCSLPCIFFEKNHFVENLKSRARPVSRLAVVCSDPDSCDLNDEMAQTFACCFAWHGMAISSVEVVDGRSERDAAWMILDSDIVVLGGGHVPTQAKFFEKIGLRELLRGYPGIVMGVSAGSMNCATEVYAQPELEGESVDPNYAKFFPGLNLANINILPHYQQVKDYTLDGRRLYEDITFSDSFGREFIVLPDASYVLVENGGAEIFGEAHLLTEGEIRTICEDGQSIVLE